MAGDLLVSGGVLVACMPWCLHLMADIIMPDFCGINTCLITSLISKVSFLPSTSLPVSGYILESSCAVQITLFYLVHYTAMASKYSYPIIPVILLYRIILKLLLFFLDPPDYCMPP